MIWFVKFIIAIGKEVRRALLVLYVIKKVIGLMSVQKVMEQVKFCKYTKTNFYLDIRQGKCFLCGSTNHKMKDCPKKRSFSRSRSKSSKSRSRSRSRSRDRRRSRSKSHSYGSRERSLRRKSRSKERSIDRSRDRSRNRDYSIGTLIWFDKIKLCE